VSPGHVASIKPGIPQGDGALAANVKAIHTKRDHRRFLGKRANPVVNVLGIAPQNPSTMSTAREL
jgi:hypothetical protein